MRRTAVLASLALAFTTTACQDAVTEPTRVDLAPAHSVADAGLSRTLPVIDLAAMTDQAPIDGLRCAINADDYVCSTTVIQNYYLDDFYGSLAADRAATIAIYYAYADYIPMYDALYYQTSATPQYFGYNGEYTEVMVETERDIKRFFDIRSDNIQVIGMHGSMLTDIERSARVYRLLSGFLGIPRDSATAVATRVAAAVQSPAWRGGNHSYLSFNAFAISFSLGDKIVMGDGILAAYENLGFGDVAPQAIFAHEFGHHIQYENGYFNDAIVAGLDEPEQTRYTELMADAYSAYYMTHKRGLAMNKHRVSQFLQVFFEIGDCAFDNGNHHGTPNQRMRAAQFGYDVADSARKQGHILTTAAFHDLFVAAYPAMIAPDAV